MRAKHEDGGQCPPYGRIGRVGRALPAALLVCFFHAFSSAQTQPATAPTSDRNLLRAHGRVIDPSGKPVSGAVVSFVGSGWESETPYAQVRSAADGTFEISVRKSQFPDVRDATWGYASVAASALGFGPAWERWENIDPTADLVLHLVPDDVPIDGRILDLEGRPVKGAAVRIRQISQQAVPLQSLSIDGSFDLSYMTKVSALPLAGYVVYAKPVTTDDAGRFRLAGLGHDRTVSLEVTGPGIAFSEMNVVTRRQPTESRDFQAFIQVRRTVYGSSFEFNAEPDRVIVGTVRDAQTGKPLEGVKIQPDNGSLGRPNPGVQAISDHLGHYRLEGLFKRKRLVITAFPTDDQCYYMRDIPVPESEGFAPTTMDFELHQGIWITGKVTDLATGQPVADTRINYLPYISNGYVSKLPEFHRAPPAFPRIPGVQSRYNTKADGTYRIVGAPGPAIITAWATRASYRMGYGSDQIKCPKNPNGGHFDTYDPWPSKNHPNAMKEIDIAENAKDASLDLELDPGINIHVTVVDLDGHPLTNYYCGGIRKAAEFDVKAFRPDEHRTLWF
ncbi:MAG TPA: carboxypeptidase-like regulatory domain-containing protein, partial [Humisphaera sp.]|nr:carboxypeptidase-like regulatory domain-containing protein [Humisphaera sp.]